MVLVYICIFKDKKLLVSKCLSVAASKSISKKHASSRERDALTIPRTSPYPPPVLAVMLKAGTGATVEDHWT